MPIWSCLFPEYVSVFFRDASAGPSRCNALHVGSASPQAGLPCSPWQLQQHYTSSLWRKPSWAGHFNTQTLLHCWRRFPILIPEFSNHWSNIGEESIHSTLCWSHETLEPPSWLLAFSSLSQISVMHPPTLGNIHYVMLSEWPQWSLPPLNVK